MRRCKLCPGKQGVSQTCNVYEQTKKGNKTDLWRRGSNTVAGYLLRDIANGHKHTREFPCFDRSRLKTNHYNWA